VGITYLFSRGREASRTSSPMISSLAGFSLGGSASFAGSGSVITEGAIHETQKWVTDERNPFA